MPDLSELDGSNGFAIAARKIAGIAAGDYSGTAVSNAGDINGDGITATMGSRTLREKSRALLLLTDRAVPLAVQETSTGMALMI